MIVPENRVAMAPRDYELVVRTVQSLVIFPPKTSDFLVVVTVLLLQSPKFLQT